MKLEEAIVYYSETAKECRRKARIESNDYMDMKDRAYEAEQLADWLNELKVLRERIDMRKKDKWIPCSETEPKKSGYYLCTHGGTGIVSTDYYTTQEQAEELFADPEDEYLDLEEYIGWTSKNVIAWMRRPEPWKGKQA